MKPRIGLFGGSFNPPHVAHKAMVQRVLDSGVVDEVWVIPAYEHAFGKSLAPFSDRVRMLEFLFEGMPSVTICTFEGRRKGTSYLSETVRDIKKRVDADLFFICGSDLLKDFHLWKNHEYLLKTLSFIIDERKGYPFKRLVGMSIAMIFSSLGDVSSTHLRRMLHNGQSVGDFVPASLLTYIRERRLYQ